MNKVILLGRLTRDIECKYTQSLTPTMLVKFNIAVNRRFKKNDEPDTDFIQCVAFGKTAEFISKYFNKGMMIAVVGRMEVSSWIDSASDTKRWATNVIVDEVDFAGSKNENNKLNNDEYTEVTTPDTTSDDDFPF